MSGIDPAVIRHALKTAREFGFRSVRLKHEGMAFRATLEPTTEYVEEETDFPTEGLVQMQAPVAVELESQSVGYFTVKNGLKEGSKIEKGDVIGEILAVGLPNEVIAKAGGEVEDVLVANGQPVEFGQALIRLKAGGA